MNLADKLNWRYAALYLVIAVLIIFAQPEPHLFKLGLIPICLGEAIRVWAAGYLRKDKRLTIVGPYAYVKNPLYLGTLLITIGACICARRWEILALGLVVFFCYYFPRKKRIEETRLSQIFGADYDEYRQSVPALIPSLVAYSKREKGQWGLKVIRENSEDLTFLAILVGVALIGRGLWFSTCFIPLS